MRFNILTCSEKLIAVGMDHERAKLYAEIYAKLNLFKRDIGEIFVYPIKITENIIRDIAIFTKKLLAAGEKQEIVDIQNTVFNDLVICLIIDRFGNRAEPNSINHDNQAVIKHYSIQDYIMLCKRKRSEMQD